MEYSFFSMFCWFPLYSKVNQLYAYIHPVIIGFPSYLGHRRALSRVPCAIHSVLVSILCVCAKLLSRAQLSVTPWTVACPPPLSIACSRQDYWSGLPFPSPGDLPNPGIKPASPVAPVLAGRFLTTEPPGKPIYFIPSINSGYMSLPVHPTTTLSPSVFMLVCGAYPLDWLFQIRGKWVRLLKCGKHRCLNRIIK